MSIKKFFLIFSVIFLTGTLLQLSFFSLYWIVNIEFFKPKIPDIIFLITSSILVSFYVLFKLQKIRLRSFEVVYKNWKGETNTCSIYPIKVWFGNTIYHPNPQWLLKAYKVSGDSIVKRDFAVKDILSIKGLKQEEHSFSILSALFHLSTKNPVKLIPEILDQVKECRITREDWVLLENKKLLSDFKNPTRIVHHNDKNINIYSYYSSDMTKIEGYLQVYQGQVIAVLIRN